MLAKYIVILSTTYFINIAQIFQQKGQKKIKGLKYRQQGVEYVVNHWLPIKGRLDWKDESLVKHLRIRERRYPEIENPKNIPRDPPTEPIKLEREITSISSIASLSHDPKLISSDAVSLGTERPCLIIGSKLTMFLWSKQFCLTFHSWSLMHVWSFAVVHAGIVL